MIYLKQSMQMSWRHG